MPADIKSKAKLMEAISHAWDELEAALEGLSEVEMTGLRDPQGWTVKDHLVHLTAWERGTSFFLRGRGRHEGMEIDETLYLTGGIDEINAAIQQHHKDLPLIQVMERLRSTHQQFMQTLGQLSFEELQKPYRHFLPDEPGEGDGPPAMSVVLWNSAEHYAEHIPWIQTLVRKASS